MHDKLMRTFPSIESMTELVPEQLQRFQRLFKRFCNDLDSAFERANEEYSKHMPSKGDVCESAVAKYLLESMGSRYAVATHGHIFDGVGQQSDEMDVVIFDDYWSGRFTPKDSGEPPLIPVESIYAVIQVKKTLSSSELRTAIDNIRSFKSLQRERVGPEYVTPNKRIQNLGFPGNQEVRNPYFAAVFAFSAGRAIETVFEQLKREVENVPANERPDVVMVYKEGVILPFCATCNGSNVHVNQIALDGHIPSYWLDHFDGAYSLLGFHLLLLHHLHYTILAPPKLQDLYSKLAFISRSQSLIKSEEKVNAKKKKGLTKHESHRWDTTAKPKPFYRQ